MYKECKSSLSLYGPKRAIYYIYRIQRLRYCDVNNDIGTIDLPNTVLRLVQASLFPFTLHLNLVFFLKFSAPFPSSSKNTTQSTIAYWGPWPSSVLARLVRWKTRFANWPWPKSSTLQGQSLERHSGRVNPLAIFQLVCHAFLSTLNFAFSGYSRSVEVRNCRSDQREFGTHRGQTRKTKTRIGYQIRKPVSIFRENRKPNAK